MNGAGYYAAYMAWLLAGYGDFICHRRTGLAHTSGMEETRMHLVQILLIGISCVLWLALEPGALVSLILGLAVLAHAVTAYIDSRTAYRKRDVPPVEQHLHSVLDAAPWVALGLVVFHTDYSIDYWHLQWRHQPLPASIWIAVVLPAIICCMLPALMELRQVLRVRHAVQR